MKNDSLGLINHDLYDVSGGVPAEYVAGLRALWQSTAGGVVLSETQVDALLANTAELFLNIYSFACSGHSLPGKSHRGAAIAHQDIRERREDFIRELRNTMCSWVFSKAKYEAIFRRTLELRNQDMQNATSHIQALVSEKFRKGFPQGQFGELLLFNFIQNVFKAPPMLRKMSITTNAAIERHGADAIHYRPIAGRNLVFLGEAKSYSSKYKFGEALSASVESALNTLENLSSELNLYVYEDFVDEPLRDIARQIRENALPNVVFELVCIVSYAETSDKAGANQAEIESKIEAILNERLKTHSALLSGKDPLVLQRIHFICLPFWNFDALLMEFDS